MTVLLVQCVLGRDSNLSEDQVVNTWHFSDLTTASADPGDITAILSALDGFYQEIDSMLGGQLSADIDFKVYDLADPAPRIPIQEAPGSSLVTAATGLPSEVACCLSFKATDESGVNPASLRGRVFIGPLSPSWLDAPALGAVRPAAGFTTALRTAAVNMNTAVQTSPSGYQHVVYSPTRDAAGSTLIGATRAVVQYSTDNAFDTQRRRGSAPTLRLTSVA